MMISIYREGQRSNIGLNIGWVRGLVIKWVWPNLQKEEVYHYCFRIRTRGGLMVYTDSKSYDDSDRARAEHFCLEHNYHIVTAEAYSDFVNPLGKGATRLPER